MFTALVMSYKSVDNRAVLNNKWGIGPSIVAAFDLLLTDHYCVSR